MKLKPIYEDGLVFATIVEKPVAVGHLRLHIKKKIRYMEELTEKEINHVFTITSYLATAAFEAMNAMGTNIIINNGIRDDVEINVIPRFDGDGLNFQWEMKRASPEKLAEIQKKLKQHTDYIGLAIEDKPMLPEEEKEEDETAEEDYRIRQLNRVP